MSFEGNEVYAERAIKSIAQVKLSSERAIAKHGNDDDDDEMRAVENVKRSFSSFS
jgi:hypothetical protein